MSTKMKGLLKGLRYISQIFDEEKEQEMQIGLPTDVKHVAHIGWEGPALHDSPSWMKEYSSSSAGFSAPLGHSGELKDNSDAKWVSEDSKISVQTQKSSQGKEQPEVAKSSRRQASTDNNPNESPRKKDPASKSRHSRRKEGKDSSESGVKSNQETSGSAQDVPRKARRKKSKELAVVNEGGSRRSRSRATTSNGSTDQLGPDATTTTSQLTTVASLNDEQRENRVTFKE